MAGRTNSQQTARTAVKSRARVAAEPRRARRRGRRSPAGSRHRAQAAREAPGPRGGAAQAAGARARRRELIALVLVRRRRLPVRGAAGRAEPAGCWAAVRPRGSPSRSATWPWWCPCALLVVAVTTVFEVALRRSYWFVGAMVFLFGCSCWWPRARRRSAATASTTSCGPSSKGGPGAWVKPSTRCSTGLPAPSAWASSAG